MPPAANADPVDFEALFYVVLAVFGLGFEKIGPALFQLFAFNLTIPDHQALLRTSGARITGCTSFKESV